MERREREREREGSTVRVRRRDLSFVLPVLCLINDLIYNGPFMQGSKNTEK